MKNYGGVKILKLGSAEEAKFFCFSYQDQLITNGYGDPLTLYKSGNEKEDILKTKGFIDCLIALGQI